MRPQVYYPEASWKIARAIVFTAAFSVATLGLLYAGLTFVGPLNDLANALIGLLAMLLIGRLHAPLGSGKPAMSVWLGWTGGIAVVLGSLPVALGLMHWTAGGMLTGFGYGLLGVWLLTAARTGTGSWTPDFKRLGTVAGALMSFGLIAGPDLGLRAIGGPMAWGIYLATASGILLYFLWCWRLTSAIRRMGERG